MKLEAIEERLEFWAAKDDKLSGTGQISGTRYCLLEYEAKMKDFTKEFIFHNLLHMSEFPGGR